MLANLFRFGRNIFFLGNEYIHSYFDALLKATLVFLGGCAVLYAGSSFLGTLTYILAAVWFVAYLVIAAPVIISTIFLSRIPAFAKFLEILGTVIIFFAFMAYIRMRCDLVGFPVIMKVVGFTAFLAMLGQIFFGEGIHPKHITKAAYWVTLAILLGVLPFLFIVPSQARASLSSGISNGLIGITGARPERMEFAICDSFGKKEVCNNATGRRVELRKPNGDPAVFVGIYEDELEFYNNSGTHPITGDPLRPATASDLAITKKGLMSGFIIQEKKKQEEERINRQKKEEAAKQEQERLRQEEQQRAEDQKKFEEARRPWAVPAGTEISVSVPVEITSENEYGPIECRLSKPVTSGDNIIIPEGTTVFLRVFSKKGTPSEEPLLRFSILSIGRGLKPAVREIEITGEKPSKKSKIGKIIGGTIIGAIGGAIIDGKRGAAIGAGGGTGVGVIVAKKTGAQQIYVHAGWEFKFLLTEVMLVPKF